MGLPRGFSLRALLRSLPTNFLSSSSSPTITHMRSLPQRHASLPLSSIGDHCKRVTTSILLALIQRTMAPFDNITFGVELEFIVFYMRKSTSYTATDSNSLWGPITAVPDVVGWDKPDYARCDHGCQSPASCTECKEAAREGKEHLHIHQHVAAVIQSTGAQAHCRPYPRTNGTDTYKTWNVASDGSLKLPRNVEHAYYPLRYAGVEVISPVFSLVEEAFEEITRVIRAIKANLRTAVPPVCGLHVHIGRGGKPLDLFSMQRIASLLWMAEPLLNNLHAGCRLGNEHCLGPRHFSRLGTGDVYQRLGSNSHHADLLSYTFKERSKPLNLTHDDRPYVTADTTTTPTRKRATQYPIVELVSMSDEAECVYDNALYGARELLRTDTAGDVAFLMSCTSWKRLEVRGAYNFDNLGFYEENLYYDEEKGSAKPTIEFRQAAGTLDEEWVVRYIRICAALCGQAVVEAPNDDFFQLLYNCQRGELSPQSYNLFDLLHDLGMAHSDIMAVHARLSKKDHELEPRLRFCRAVTCPSSEISRMELKSVLARRVMWDVESCT
ncbi:hypothetical protein F5Y18DRAFT_401385 [Xylariaceae sp. FL1019]|nr:hypothetical protein F5Y18DRAFT_401385 [Xylariaceae sp. FL1019]